VRLPRKIEIRIIRSNRRLKAFVLFIPTIVVQIGIG